MFPGSATRNNEDEVIKRPKLSSDLGSSEDSSSVVSQYSSILFSTLGERGDQEISSPPSVSSENKEGEEKDRSVETEEEPEEQSWWELDSESGKYVEKGPAIRGFKLKLRMKVKVRDDHLLLKHVEAGNGKIQCEVKVNNVREELGIKHGTLEQPIRMETHTSETHPLVCPFSCPETNDPCEASFQRIDQKYFVEHCKRQNTS